MCEWMTRVSLSRSRSACLKVLLALFSVLLVSSSIVGCVQQPPPPPPPPSRDEAPPQPEMLVHEVKYQGETLALIANWYTGRTTNWTLIRDANPGLRPERMNLGMFIKIPGYLVTQWEPLPRRLVQDSLGRGGRGRQPTPKEVAEDESRRPSSPEGFDPSRDDDFEKAFNEAMQDPPSSAEVVAPKPVAEEPPVVEQAPPPVQAPAAGSGDAERERLLDELLTQ